MPDAFQRGAFQDPGFQFDDEAGTLGGASSISDTRIPRWLLKFERLGQITYLSDVGGEIEGIFYVPAVDSFQPSEFLIDLERMQTPRWAATVHISPSALREHFIDINELGQAKVTVSSWNGYKARPIIKADMQGFGAGYDGELSSFRLTEEFRHNAHFPATIVDLGAFTSAELIQGARWQVYPQVWGSAKQVPSFQLLMDGDETRFMVAGHNVAVLPEFRERYKDRLGNTYIGFQTASPPATQTLTDFSEAQFVNTAGDLLKLLIKRYSQYEADELDQGRLQELYAFLAQFSAAGYTNSEGPLFNLIAQRFQSEFMFVVWQQAGLLTGAGINPTAAPARVLVYGVHLLQLEDEVKEEQRYTRFKIRYRYLTYPQALWYGKQTLDDRNSTYLKEAHRRWGGRTFGDAVDLPIHNNSVDLSDVYTDGTAKNVTMRYAQLFHRGQRAKYLQLAEFADIPLGQVVALVDPERGYDLKPAILIGRNWLTPELIQQTYRTIEPFELVEPSIRSTGTAMGIGEGGECPNVFGGLASWTEIPGAGSGSSFSGDTWRIDHPYGSGVQTWELKKHIDSADWGSCTQLRVSFDGDLTIDFQTSVSAITFGFWKDGVLLLEEDETGFAGSQLFSFSHTFAAPVSGDVRFVIDISDTLAGHAAITITEFDLIP